MVDKSKITVVLPVLNEEEAIGLVIDEVKGEGCENILVVDGYSTDLTVEIAKAHGAKVVQQHGRGKAGAIKTAIDLVETPYMVVMDGDYTYDPKDIEKFLTHAEKYDLIIGVRSKRKNIPTLHRLGNRIINFVFNLLMGSNFSDVCSGMYLLRTETAKNLDIKSRGFDVEVEIAAQLYSAGRVSEIPINYRKRIGQRKLSTWKSGLRIVTSIIGLARAYNPIFLLSTIASTFAAPGIIILIWQLAMRYLYGAKAWSIGAAWLGLVLLIIGIQGFTVSTISLLLKRLEKRLLTTIKR